MFKTIVYLLQRFWPQFLQGIGITLSLSAITVFFGVILGSLIAMMKMAKLHIGKFKPLSFLATVYIEIIRGTPLLLQLYFFYFFLPEVLPFLDNKFICVCVALVLNSAAYVAEIIRAGIEAVDKGQTEAARSLGLNGRQTMLKIVLPQAVKNILPALCNEFIMVIKETSLASTFFIGDLMTQYREISGALYLILEPFIIVGIIYFVLTFTLSKVVAWYERRLRTSD
ncbi:MAG: amino acid ABC transporter permease [Christensenellaceae bacterium]|jgi:His/Glu/Gln/Arg/opine family amino acid ABC transporter permease subunit